MSILIKKDYSIVSQNFSINFSTTFKKRSLEDEQSGVFYERINKSTLLEYRNIFVEEKINLRTPVAYLFHILVGCDYYYPLKRTLPRLLFFDVFIIV